MLSRIVQQRRPLIGISACLDEGRLIRRSRNYLYVSDRYVTAIEAVDAVPVVVPITERPDVLDRLDALVLTGGDDIHPRHYGQPVSATDNLESERRVESDRRLLEGALERELPVLAICYGMQLLNVIRGGTLFQTLPTDPLDHGAPSVATHHPVKLLPGSQLAKVYAADSLGVRSSHRQGIERLGRDLVAAAVAPDGLVEACELGKNARVVAVQWHPETSPDGHALYSALAQWARKSP